MCLAQLIPSFRVTVEVPGNPFSWLCLVHLAVASGRGITFSKTHGWMAAPSAGASAEAPQAESCKGLRHEQAGSS